ncbi:MAG: helix-turn-helix domain-containing protein [Syntrophomonadaceae bacterium]|jgi:AraC-like DNA-binding protein|nr:helix-turn-helix domain-containing protein [Syntrophomonadaceae bacterium]
MYYPVQIPFILNQRFAETVRYTEEISPLLGDFVICFWEMAPLTKRKIEIDNVIVTDGCIDLVVEYDSRHIGYAGMSKTEFHYKIDSAAQCMGARLKPGAFHQLTGLPAGAAMDTFLPLETADKAFDTDAFFALSFERAKVRFREYVGTLTNDKTPDNFILLFDALSGSPPVTTEGVYNQLHFSSRQCQRLFAKHFGLTPQMALCIIRFQKCLEVLARGKAAPSDILNITTYYDQSHFIKDFKRNLGLTPFELIRRYKR